MHRQDGASVKRETDDIRQSYLRYPVIDSVDIEPSIIYRNESCERAGYILVTRGKKNWYLACLGFINGESVHYFPSASAHMHMNGERNTWEEAIKDLRDFLNCKDSCVG